MKGVYQIVSVGHVIVLGWGGGGEERKNSGMGSRWIPI